MHKNKSKVQSGIQMHRVFIFCVGLALSGCSFGDLLTEGTKAPDFTLQNQDGRNVTLSQELTKGHVVLYFYPKDNTPGCIKEACSFRDLSEEFLLAGATVFGVSTDDVESHAKFHAKYNLTFPLLADPHGTVTALYGATGILNLASRVTFLIDSNAIIRKVYPDVDVKTHSVELLQAVRELNAEATKP